MTSPLTSPSPQADFDVPFPSGLKKRRIYNHPYWRQVRRALLAERPACEWCGSDRRLEVHHKEKPRSDNHQTWFSVSNLVVICRDCHFTHHHREREEQKPVVWQQWNQRVQQLMEDPKL